MRILVYLKRDLQTKFNSAKDGLNGANFTLQDIINHSRKSIFDSIGVEYMHIQSVRREKNSSENGLM